MPADLEVGELALNTHDRVLWVKDASGNITELCRHLFITAVAPATPSAGALWLDIGAAPHELKQWDGATWAPVFTSS